MGTCSETICKHRIFFPSIQHWAWLPQGRPQGKQKCGLTHWLKHRITLKLLKIDWYMMRGVWQALNCLSIYATYCVIVAGTSPGKQKCGLRYVKTAIFCTCGSNNWETLEDRGVHAARQFVSIEFSFHPYNIERDCPRVVPRGNKNVVKIAIFGLTHWLTHRLTRKLLKIDRYILRSVWQALNCLSIHATYCVIVAGETKMWAAVRENGDFFTFVDHVKTNKHMFEFFSPSGSHTIMVYRTYTDTKHRAASLRQQSFLLI